MSEVQAQIMEPKGTRPDTYQQIVAAFLMMHNVAPWEADELIRWLSEGGFVVVHREPTPAMIRASKGALYKHIQELPDYERNKFKDRKRGGYRVDQRTKINARWRAMIDASTSADLGRDRA